MAFLKKWADRINQIQLKDWHVTWKDFIWFSWEWIWKFCVICSIGVMGTFLFASLNDTLSNIEGSTVYGTWMWWVFAIIYFFSLFVLIYRVGKSK